MVAPSAYSSDVYAPQRELKYCTMPFDDSAINNAINKNNDDDVDWQQRKEKVFIALSAALLGAAFAHTMLRAFERF